MMPEFLFHGSDCIVKRRRHSVSADQTQQYEVSSMYALKALCNEDFNLRPSLLERVVHGGPS